MKDKFKPFTEEILYCRQHDLLADDVGRALLRIWQADVCDERIGNMIAYRASNHQFKALFHNLPFNEPKLVEGDYVLGLDRDRQKLYSHIQYLNAHCLMVAGSGAGKTTYSRFKILQIAPRVKGMWLWDLRKREFSILKPYLARLNVDLNIIPGRSLKINPLQLSLGVDPSDGAARIADMLINVLELPARASKLLQSKLFYLYQQFDILDGKTAYPTLFDLFEAIRKDTGANPQARRAILDNLEPVLLSLGPKVLAYRFGWPSHELAQRHLIFELAGQSETDKNLILNSIILPEFSSRISRGISNPDMDLWLGLDEAQRLCSKSNGSAISDLIGLVRGTGIGLDLGIQSTHDLLPQVISNSATKILGRCGSAADYSAAGHNMGLSAEQIHWAQMNLRPGMFIGQLGEGQWRYPFVFQVPAMRFPQTCQIPVDSNVLPDLKTVYASEYTNWSAHAEQIHTDAATSSGSLFASNQEFRFCQVVVDNPMQPSSSYCKPAGISSNSAKAIRQALIDKGFICEHRMNTGSKGRSTILLEALPAGIEAVNKHQTKEVS